MSDLKSVFSHSPNVVTRKIGNEYVLVPVSNNIADMDSIYTLNETGAFIWELIDGKKNVEEIINNVVKEYETENEITLNDVLLFLDNMSNYLIINI